MSKLSDLIAACDSLANDGRYAAKTRALAKALKAWALASDGKLMLEESKPDK